MPYRHSHLNWIGGRFRAKVVTPCFEASFPGVKVHGRQRNVIRVCNEQVQRLGLVHKRTSVRGKVDECAHRHLPRRFEELSRRLRNFRDSLHRSVRFDDSGPNVFIPQVQFLERAHQVLVQHGELSRENATNKQVAGDGFKAFRVPQYLCCAGGWHRSDE